MLLLVFEIQFGVCIIDIGVGISIFHVVSYHVYHVDIKWRSVNGRWLRGTDRCVHVGSKCGNRHMIWLFLG